LSAKNNGQDADVLSKKRDRTLPVVDEDKTMNGDEEEADDNKEEGSADDDELYGAEGGLKVLGPLKVRWAKKCPLHLRKPRTGSWTTQIVFHFNKL